MLKKIIAIKNVGCFHNSAASGNPQLAKHTFIVGANGFGKTTICAVLRSLQTGKAAHVVGRKTLGVSDPQNIELLLATGLVRFDGMAWTAPYPSISIFDGVFVSENIHSGEVVEIDHKRSLYRVIIGDDGVNLAEQDSTLAAASRTKTGEIATAAKAIEPHLPQGMYVEAFIALPAVADIDQKIINQTRTVEAAQQAGAIRDRAQLSEFPLPVFPEGLSSLLGKSIDGIAKDAEQLLAQHLSDHGMEKKGGNWIAGGLEHSKNTCPFCGQDLTGLPLVTAFRAIFSDRYKALSEEISGMKTRVGQNLGDAVIGRLNTLAEQNRAATEFWHKYCVFDSTPMELPKDLPAALTRLREAAVALIDRKTATPLEPIVVDQEFSEALGAYERAADTARSVNEAIKAANVLIANKKHETGSVYLEAAQKELAKLQAVKNRHTSAVAPLCISHNALTAEKEAIDKEKENVRTKLDAHTRTVVEPYERRINDFLLAFNAGYRIAKTKHSYLGGVATSSYQLVINNMAIDVGDGKTPLNQASFKNTLSAGDRTTLALAFFLASLERDPAIAQKIVVFDDPFNS